MSSTEEVADQQQQFNTDTVTIPKRPFGSIHNNERLPQSVSIVALGCSSFSTFFMDDCNGSNSKSDNNNSELTMDRFDINHPRRVQEWIDTIEYAIMVAGITVLDTAPWYGHGTSEMVVGLALTKLLWHANDMNSDDSNNNDGTNKKIVLRREDLCINTKVGRYEADPQRQFDFTYDTTIRSVERSIRRLFGTTTTTATTATSTMDDDTATATTTHQSPYITVLQLHDPEFAPDINLLFTETIPAMLYCQTKGWCRALGITGYPLSVQHQILERSFHEYGKHIWDQSLTYGHYTLHDTSLLIHPYHSINGGHSNDDDDHDGDDDNTKSSVSFVEYCHHHQILVLAAAPLSMGLFTTRGPPEWHPASLELKEACRHIVQICQQHNVNVSTLALLFAMSHPQQQSMIATTVVGMSTIDEIKAVQAVAARFGTFEKDTDDTDTVGTRLLLSQEEILHRILTPDEQRVMNIIRDPDRSPLAQLWKTDSYQWDGIVIAHEFWKTLEQPIIDWQNKEINYTLE